MVTQKTILDENFKNRIGKLESRETIFVPKGWGWEEWIHNNELYCLKKLFCKQGKECSWHYHKLKDETFHLISGRLLVHYSTDDFMSFDAIEGPPPDGIRGWSILEPGDSFHIPPFLRHRFYGIQDSIFMEASTQHFDEDSIRLIKGD